MTSSLAGLCELVAKDFDLPLERLRSDTPLEEIELDSLAVTELVFSIEDKFGVTATEPGPEFHTLGDIASYIDELIAARDAARAAAPNSASSPT